MCATAPREMEAGNRPALRELLTSLMTGSDAIPVHGTPEFEAIVAATAALHTMVKERHRRMKTTLALFLSELLSSGVDKSLLFRELYACRLTMSLGHVRQRIAREGAKFRANPTAVFEKGMIIILLFDNIGFRKSGYKVGYDQWVLIAWQYLDQAAQHRLKIAGLSGEGRPWSEVYANRPHRGGAAA
jgi:hypothetical protein